MIGIRVYSYISRKTLRSLRPEIGEFAGQERTGAQGRVIQCRTGHGRGTDQKRQSKSRAERGQNAGQGIVQYK